MILNTTFAYSRPIYTNGVQNEALTVSSSSYISFGTSSIEVSIAGGSKKGAFITDNAIVVDGYTKLCIERERTASSSGSKTYIGLSSTSGASTSLPDICYDRVDNGATELSTFELTLSGTTAGTAYYIKWYGVSSSNTQVLDNTIYRIWLE